MLGFLLYKWFWNLWDNLLSAIVYNFIQIALIGLMALSFEYIGAYSLPALILAELLLFLLFAYVSHLIALHCYQITKSRTVEWKENFHLIRNKRFYLSFLLNTVFSLLFFSVFLSARFYWLTGGLLSYAALGFLFWFSLLFLLSVGYFTPLLIREDYQWKHCFRKAVLLSLDNLGLSIFLLIGSIIFIAISFLPPIFLFIGFFGLRLWYEVSLRILYYKYQYLEELQAEGNYQPKSRRQIPWRSLLHEERENIGPRTLQNFIFPWKG